MAQLPAEQQDLLVGQLANEPDQRARRSVVRANPGLCHPQVVERLYAEVVKLTRINLEQADRLAQAAHWLAQRMDDDYCRGQALRAAGHVLYAKAKYRQALERYQSALNLFQRLNKEIDVARTLNGALHTLIYLGRYDQALAWAQNARAIFEKHGDGPRLARLDINLGNILYRQDRFREALELYQRGYEELRIGDEPQDIAAALSNIAVCHISLNNFTEALNTYGEARTYCMRHGLPLLVAEADYNVAYLHYLRGEYTAAIGLYEATRLHCHKTGDSYHAALCDLDQSELCLELNLDEEGAQFAQRAFDSFKRLGMGYEKAKAMANLSIAAAHQNKAPVALKLFGEARKLFIREKNQVWPALIDLYQALVLFQEKRYTDAHHLCESASRFFSKSALLSKAATCELLMARLHLQAGKFRAARQRCRAVLKRLEKAESPALNCQAWFVLGQVEEVLGRREAARQAYQKAHAMLENLRSHLRGEDLTIAFLKDKLAVYESLVWMCLSEEPSRERQQEAFSYIEQAKSRSLADLIAFRAQNLPAPAIASNYLAGQVRKLREELNWCHHQIGLEEVSPEKRSLSYIETLLQRIRECEGKLAKALKDLRATDEEFIALQNGGTIELEAIRSQIPAGATMLEYYLVRGTIYVCLLNREQLKIVPLTSASKVRELLRLLQFQLSKFRLGPEYLSTFAQTLRSATEAHLRELYTELIAPIRDQITAEHLIVVPHNFLHYVPFHALLDGGRFLIDEFKISYAPSASVYYLCCVKEVKSPEQSLIMGIGDALTPYIFEEVETVASTLPNPRLVLGEAATEECLRKHGPESRFIHIATHGLFRQDNPMFSSLLLGNSQLTLFDLYQLHLSAELVTLSGCGTGLNVVVGGDELLGLVRGLLYAGAKSVLVTLWDVNDESTSEFMKLFYRQLRSNPDKTLAMQQAIQQLRQNYPHPYHWAPFVLIGTP